MDRILEIVHPDFPSTPRAIEKRRAVRGVVLRGTHILALYTRRYDDYSVPGGGVADDEDLEDALMREMAEETGARAISILKPLGRIDESRPSRGAFDAMHMQSFVYHCQLKDDLGEPTMESYEINNGMRPEWIDIWAAIRHNQGVIQRSHQSMGISIVRETRLLEWIATKLL